MRKLSILLAVLPLVACQFDGATAGDPFPDSDADDDVDSAPSTDPEAIGTGIFETGNGVDNDAVVAPGCQWVASAAIMNLYVGSDAAREDFEHTTVENGQSCTDGPLSDETDSRCAVPGAVVAGLMISDSEEEVCVFGSSVVASAPGQSVGAAAPARALDLVVSDERHWFGFETHGQSFGYASVRFFDDTDQEVASREVRLGTMLGTGHGAYLGLACARPIGRVEVTPVASDLVVVVDNIVFK